MNEKPASGTIPNQVKLPLRVAFGVVIQGLRIRLGRSIVTITGVTCGIAFLMSILTGQLVKMGVADEDSTRAEVGRILSFIRSDLPKLQDKDISVIGSGTLSEVETRVLESIAKDFGVKSLRLEPGKSPTPIRKISSAQEATANDSDVIFLMGGDKPPAYDWTAFLSQDLNRVVASTILSSDAATIGVSNDRFTKLARVLSAEEQEKLAANKRKEKFRAIWIGIISLLVTVIGIANAMLMSVTERFREIGTMKCLGALSSFVTQMFVLEASLMGLVGGIVGAVAGALFAIVIYTAIRNYLPVASKTMQMPLEVGSAAFWDMLWTLAMRLAMMLLVMAFVDYLYQKWEFERSIRMSKQEIKEEYKQMEGDPQVKSKIRQKQREMAKNRMMADVPKADVVITNPTTLAIALSYDRAIMGAPQVVAKGRGYLAQRIRELAQASKVPVIENKPLAWALYEGVEVGEEIPEDLYRGVAEILAMVYRLRAS